MKPFAILSAVFTLAVAAPFASAQVNAALGALVTSSAATYGGQVAANLTDGNLANQSHPLAEFDTLGFTYTVDLGQAFNLDEIVLWNRTGCCPERLSNYRVSIHPDDGAGMPAPAVWTTDVRTDGSNSGDAGSDSLTGDLDPDGTFAGRFITVENLSNEAYNPQIAELQAFTNDEVPEPPVNLALNAPAGFFTAEDLAVEAYGGLPASNATDGVSATITHPADMVSADYYLAVDLGSETVIGSIAITGRIFRDECCPERLEDATLELLDDGLNLVSSQVLAGQVTTTQTIEFPAAPSARYIRVVNSNGADYGPQIGEIEVYAPVGPGTPFTITAFATDTVTGDASLTFNSNPGASYSVFGSNSMGAFWAEINDSVPSDGEETTYDFTDLELIGQPRRFYQVRRN